MNLNFKDDIICLIKHLSKLLESDFEQRVSQVGLTSAQARVLFFINKKNNIEKQVVHQNDVEKEFKLAKSTVNGLISRLVKNGFIQKKTDRRYVVLEITELGVNTISLIRQGRAKTINRLFDGYSQEEKQTTLDKLNKLINNLEGGNENA